MAPSKPRRFSKISKRTSLVHAQSQAHRTRQERALQTVLLSLNSEKSIEKEESRQAPSQAEQSQQLCPFKPLPNDFLRYESSERPNPVFGSRGKLRLDSFQVSMLNFRSQLKPSEPLYRPQGAHPITGQALPPLFNNNARLATGEDTAALTEQGYRFAFQVVNNNYHIQNPVPGSLNICRQGDANQTPPNIIKKPSSIGSKRKDADESNTVSRKKTQSTFVSAVTLNSGFAASHVPEIPRSCSSVRDILRMWSYSDLSKGLKKPLKDWGSDERNGKISRPHGKMVTNRKLYSRRKVQAMCFFHFCETHSVEQYVSEFTELKQKNVIGKNYTMALAYSKKHSFKEVFKDHQSWKVCTERVLDHSDVQEALKL